MATTPNDAAIEAAKVALDELWAARCKEYLNTPLLTDMAKAALTAALPHLSAPAAGELSEEDKRTVAYWRPSETNKSCTCAGDYVCAPHALIAIIDRLATERERCAKIADQFARANENLNDGTDAPGAIAAASAIAAEIRKE